MFLSGTPGTREDANMILIVFQFCAWQRFDRLQCNDL